MTKTLILGGMKSGKSQLAEKLAIATGSPVTYIATAQQHDDEMRARIKHHQQQRPSDWQTVETAIYLSSALDTYCQYNHCVVVDCLTMWLTNLLMSENTQLLKDEVDKLYACLSQLPGTIIMVTNETNMGIVPVGELSRRYCDEAGLLHQRLAALSDRVILTVAGLPQLLKGHLNEHL